MNMGRSRGTRGQGGKRVLGQGERVRTRVIRPQDSPSRSLLPSRSLSPSLSLSLSLSGSSPHKTLLFIDCQVLCISTDGRR